MAVDATLEPCERPRFLFGLCFDPAEASRMPCLVGENNPFEFVKSNIESAQQLGSQGMCRTAEHHGLWWQEADVSKIIN